MIIKSKDSIEAKIRYEKEGRRIARRQEDILKGLTRSSDAQRGDFIVTKKFDKTLDTFRRFKNPQDRKKIESEYIQMQRESRRK